MTPRRAILLAGLTVGAVGSWVGVTRQSDPGPADWQPTSYPPSAVLPNDPLLERIARKTEAADALLRGELTLAEAAARFREANEADPAALVELRRQFPGACEDELTWRQVMNYVYAGAYWSPARWATRLRGLEAEFHARFPAAGPIPDWARARPGTPDPGPGSPPRMIRKLPVPVQ